MPSEQAECYAIVYGRKEPFMPKRAAKFDFPSITLDGESLVPLYGQLYESLRSAVLTGRLLPGARLPSSRALAARLGISRNTVLNTYEQLQAEGFVTGRVGSGTRVARALPATYCSNWCVHHWCIGASVFEGFCRSRPIRSAWRLSRTATAILSISSTPAIPRTSSSPSRCPPLPLPQGSRPPRQRGQAPRAAAGARPASSARPRGFHWIARGSPCPGG